LQIILTFIHRSYSLACVDYVLFYDKKCDTGGAFRIPININPFSTMGTPIAECPFYISSLMSDELLYTTVTVLAKLVL